MTKIQWTEKTYNPIVGCTRVSPGCEHCYAERMARRLQAMGQEKYQGTIDKNGRWTGVLNLGSEETIEAPLRNKKPMTYFVNSMSDLFHKEIPFWWLKAIWDVMRDTPQHTYQILTKRAGRMAQTIPALVESYGILPNVWLGVSVENQKYAGERIPYLLQTPAAIRFLSCEPLLGPVDLDGYVGTELQLSDYDAHIGDGVDWVIIGGESGPGARPFDLSWAYSLVSQCQAAGVAVFVKQLGRNPIDGINGYKTGYPIKDAKGGDMAEWPAGLQIREVPQ